MNFRLIFNTMIKELKSEISKLLGVEPWTFLIKAGTFNTEPSASPDLSWSGLHRTFDTINNLILVVETEQRKDSTFGAFHSDRGG